MDMIIFTIAFWCGLEIAMCKFNPFAIVAASIAAVVLHRAGLLSADSAGAGIVGIQVGYCAFFLIAGFVDAHRAHRERRRRP